ncbi:FMN-binding protein [Amycolatopsis alkalitolerans]|uniref:FMN-binding protein n=1 Tax=Amycolatopsis alkalitolerans TaxID=2547244 RepID=A0A5C4LVT5_9PSEU|nr:FMN-binding protein [Amycolatopsis alkalitolerans]TNC23532.1 FMN-binding protein [Amycolatopsis alkalitolerans]
MRKFFIVLMFAIAGLLPLLRYHPETSATAAAPGPVATLPAAPPTQTSPSTSPSTSGQPSTAPPARAATEVVNGSTVDSDYGPYQVQVTFTGNRITDVRLITEPSDRHSQRIAGEAAPTLREEALQAQSSRIDTVSGATITSESYAQSLQAAIDAKGH